MSGARTFGNAIMVDCIGEAHHNPFIDNCWVCAPFWERYPTCPTHGKRLSDRGYCKDCRKHYRYSLQPGAYGMDGVAQVHDSNEGFESPPTPPICEDCNDEGCDNCEM